ncbi:MAG TPA: acyltransferase family protein [Acidimicrobiales bacterium]|nr:acyltransferase family protein [Acidimicrobiales bacterium]
MRIRPAAGERRLPALDGLRAVAVVMVMAYHGGVPGLRTAGFYGVDVFFVLSGFLITTLLLGEEADSGRLRTLAFWGRRARRLLPGLLLMLAAVDLYVARLAPAGRYPGFRGDGLSVVAYISNWHYIAASSNYFQATGVPSLLTHTWSLAIEEQFYLVWPLVLLVAIRVGRRLERPPAAVVAAVAAAGALASAAWMAVLYGEGAGPSRLYYGTDTHAQSILAGAALAGLVTARPQALSRLARTPVAVLAGAGLLWAAVHMGATDPVAYRGGFLFVAVASALLISVLVGHPAGPGARLLSVRPVVYVGRISYGMYLWYFPLFEVLDHARTGLAGAGLFAVRCGADVAAAAASFHLVEEPVRRWRPGGRRIGRRLAPLAVGATAIAAVAGLVLADTPDAFSAGGLPPSATLSAGGPVGTTRGHATRILVVGDSTGAVLGMDLAFSVVEQRYGISVDDRALFGCGLVVSAEVGGHGVPIQPSSPCFIGTPPDRQWPALLQADLTRARPDVVLVAAGRWEVQDRRPTAAGRWVDITDPTDSAYVRQQLELATSIVASAGVRVALATAPCFSSGEQPDGRPWPEDSPARVKAYNNLVRSVVNAHSGVAALVDLDAMVCPGGRYHESLGATKVRAPDGIHYPVFSTSAPDSPAPDRLADSEAFGLWIAPKILAALGPTG